jgi:hypothetical protein
MKNLEFNRFFGMLNSLLTNNSEIFFVSDQPKNSDQISDLKLYDIYKIQKKVLNY